jgi:cysteine-rich repeat protein
VTWLVLIPTLLLFAIALLSLPGATTFLGSQTSTCRNGVVDPREQCDDGNLNNYDGCSTGCRTLSGWACTGSTSICHRGCGNGIVKTAYGEQCDDQNDEGGDGCTRICTIEKGWACTGEPSHCYCAKTAAECGLVFCGDGKLDRGEECDNGRENGRDDDACKVNCSVKDGYVCKGALGGPSICSRDLSIISREGRFLRGVN